MAEDLVARARRMVELLEGGDATGVTELLSARIRDGIEAGWSLEAFIREEWHAGLDDLAGASRVLPDGVQISPSAARFTIEGDLGMGIVTIAFDEDGGVGGVAIRREEFEGIGTIVVTCPDERVEELSSFYTALLGEDRWRIPRLAFDEGRDYQPPIWGDPKRPQQLHLDVFVGDVDAAEELVLSRGATRLQAADDSRTYADPIGHPFCLYPQGLSDTSSVLGRVVIDCPDPLALAPFYHALLGMTVEIESSENRVVLAHTDGHLPMLAFRRVTPYVAPRWPDPRFPPQMHFDMKFDDADAAIALVERLGAVLLPPQGGSCPVYADPVGHPFCLCKPGQ